MLFLAEVIPKGDLFPLPVPGLRCWGVNCSLERERGKEAVSLVPPPASLACRAEGLFPVSLGRTERSPEMCTRAGFKAALDKPFSCLNLFQSQQVHGICCAPRRDAPGAGKRLKCFIFPGNKTAVAKKVCLLTARPEWRLQALNAPLQLGLLEG